MSKIVQECLRQIFKQTLKENNDSRYRTAFSGFGICFRPKQTPVTLSQTNALTTSSCERFRRGPFDFGRNDAKRSGKHADLKFDSTVFARHNNASRPDFTIHPEWVSEALSVRAVTSSNRCVQPVQQLPQRRCKSAPPPRSRNPITWENW